MLTKPRFALGALAALLVALSLFALASAGHGAVIDFEGLAEGAIVSSVSSGSGISGMSVAGSVSVFGFNPNIPGPNTAMIFDATCTGGCSGGDNDLRQPSLGNVLIISEDLDSSDPDDADVVGSVFEFNFSGWGPGVVTVESITILDVEIDELGDAQILLFSGGPGGTLIGSVPIPDIGNGNMQVIPVGVSGVDFMEIDLDGSGAIDNIEIIPVQQVTPPTNTATTTPTSTPTNTPVGPSPTPTATITPGGPTLTPTSTSPTGTGTPIIPVTGPFVPITGLSDPRPSHRGLSYAAALLRRSSFDLALAPAEGGIPAPARVPERIVIPALGVNAYVLPVGLETAYIDGDYRYVWDSPHAFAAGWHQTSARLGARGNTVLNGHNNAYGAVFRYLNNLSSGDTILIHSSEGQTFRYVVSMKVIFEEEGLPLSLRQQNTHWIQSTSDERLTLVSCWPYDSDRYRLVLIAVRAYRGGGPNASNFF